MLLLWQLRAAAAKEAGTCVTRVATRGVEDGGSLQILRLPYKGQRVELWRASDWLKHDQRPLKAKQSRQTRVKLLEVSGKNQVNEFWTIGRARGVRFDFILVNTCLWPQTDEGYKLVQAYRPNVYSP